MAGDGRIGASDLLLAFLLGTAAGAAVALLFAPASGRETREFLGEKAREGQDKAAELARQSREAFARQKEHLVNAIDRGREAYTQARSEKGSA